MSANQRQDSRLLRLDAGLEGVAATVGLGREGGVRRVTEPLAEYAGSAVDAHCLATIGATIAEMRREYSA